MPDLIDTPLTTDVATDEYVVVGGERILKAELRARNIAISEAHVHTTAPAVGPLHVRYEGVEADAQAAVEAGQTITSDVQAKIGDVLFIDAQEPIVVTLPRNPSVGDVVVCHCVGGSKYSVDSRGAGLILRFETLPKPHCTLEYTAEGWQAN
jgi:hypothetical protein